jgi:hypothetical protein
MSVREAMSCPVVAESAEQTEAAKKMARPVSSARLLPKRSPS